MSFDAKIFPSSLKARFVIFTIEIGCIQKLLFPGTNKVFFVLFNFKKPYSIALAFLEQVGTV
jgi:hypothetical protein